MAQHSHPRHAEQRLPELRQTDQRSLQSGRARTGWNGSSQVFRACLQTKVTYSVWHRPMLMRIRNVNGRKDFVSRFPEQDSRACGKRGLVIKPSLQAKLMARP